MKISVFGLGYVGLVTAANFAGLNHEVIGVEINLDKINKIKKGTAPFYEKGLNEILSKAITNDYLIVTNDPKKAIMNSDVSFICVGTPNNKDGSMNLNFVKNVCKEIGRYIKYKDTYHVVVLRSTILPGTTESIVIPIIEKESNKQCNIDFGVCVNPEFLREGEGVYDFLNPERIIIGESDGKSGKVVSEIYSSFSAPILNIDIKKAEMIKYVDNSFHGLKVAFANEIGSICNELGINGYEVMKIFCMDKKLNLSSYYLKPGLPFGGSCIPKDVSALCIKLNDLNMNCKLIESILPSNEEHLIRIIDIIEKHGKRNIGIIGLSFKTDTDDFRGSVAIKLYEMLKDSYYNVFLFDHNLSVDNNLNISNITLSDITTSLEELTKKSAILIVMNMNDIYKKFISYLNDDHVIIDINKFLKKTDVKQGLLVQL